MFLYGTLNWLALLWLLRTGQAHSYAGTSCSLLHGVKVYCYGGISGRATPNNATIMLDLTTVDFREPMPNFNWVALQPQTTAPLQRVWSAQSTTINNGASVLFYGGLNATKGISYTSTPFVTVSDQGWQQSTVQNPNANLSNSLNISSSLYAIYPAIVDLSPVGKTQLLIFGGLTNDTYAQYEATSRQSTEMAMNPAIQIFDYVANTWAAAPAGSLNGYTRAFHTATLMPSTNAVFILGGNILAATGYTNQQLAPMSEVWVFNLTTSQWLNQTATYPSSVPFIATRRFHTATAIPDTGYIMLIGGLIPFNFLSADADTSQLCVIYDSVENEYVFPNITNPEDAPTVLVYHSSILFHDHATQKSLIGIFFGALKQNGPNQETHYLLDVTDSNQIAWLAASAPTPSSSVLDLSPPTIAGIVVGAGAGVGVLLLLLVIYLKRLGNASDDPSDSLDKPMPIQDSDRVTEASVATESTVRHLSILSPSQPSMLSKHITSSATDLDIEKQEQPINVNK
ncbi:hypothetical protein DM01DRAFT_1369493 [Hesseltinella vesiculosa]|uniref:Attractin/MKLN-like beta-propeller domain-containing protein n=1 Tax=Hesseltinella vesiculosa TaxID=101127 RepID=A0A1X2GXU8_9FUNG|nr:hypothetical protein DM01DRAFT_1369493 [Hesseltinella vesiculosa]